MPPGVREIPLTLVRGFVMGAADVVPGVSGGTVALVFAIYHRLIDAVRTGSNALGRFLKGDLRGGVGELRSVEWLFFVPLVSGIGLAVVSMSGVIESLLEDRPVEMSGLFLGLVGGSVVVAWELLGRRDAARLGVLAATSVVTFLVLGLSESTSTDVVAGSADLPLLTYFGSGALAICAMILPGISGSFILVMIGMYGSVLGAVNDRDIPAVAAVALGCVVGLALFSQVLHWALNRHYDTVMAALIGLMIGSLRVLWPWPDGVGSTALGAPEGPVLWTVVMIIGGAVVVVAFNEVAKRLERRTTRDEADELRSV